MPLSSSTHARFAFLLQVERTKAQSEDDAGTTSTHPGPLQLITVNTQDHEIIVGDPEEA